MKNAKTEICFLYASSEESADVFYRVGAFVPDPFLCLIVDERALGVVNRLEYGRLEKASRLDEVLLLEEAKAETAKWIGCATRKVGPVELMRFFAAWFEADAVVVPADFPAIHYRGLVESGLRVRIGPTPFFPGRARKTDAEARAIREGNAASAAGIRAAEAVLREARIREDRLIHGGRELTAERLRCVIDQTCLEHGAVARNTIVACGAQACDPHETGHGPLRPYELIIVDVFPRIQATGYHGDMTRTFVKGMPNDARRGLVDAVRSAQAAALRKVGAGVKGAAVHREAKRVFEEWGYVTERRDGAHVGFIHSTGHGLGLEVHESPRVGPEAGPLRKGNVITVEPGLYYPDIGGCRIEDVVRVTGDGAEPLSSLHYEWVIP